jgi:hypothetical protein
VISDADRLQLENETLRACVQSFANVRDPEPHIAALVERSRNALRQVAARRKAIRPKEEELIEQTCFLIANHCRSSQHIPAFEPFIVLERSGKRSWEALIDEYEESIGIGQGPGPLVAVRELLARLKSYEARIARGIRGWHPDRSWNTCKRQNCRGALERLRPSATAEDEPVDGEDLRCIECGAAFFVQVDDGEYTLLRARKTARSA